MPCTSPKLEGPSYSKGETGLLSRDHVPQPAFQLQARSTFSGAASHLSVLSVTAAPRPDHHPPDRDILKWVHLPDKSLKGQITSRSSVTFSPSPSCSKNFQNQ